MINKSLIFKDVEVLSNEGALRFLASKLVEQEYVKESYIEAVIERENVYPTGLPTGGYGVAIPHTDVIHVNKPAIAISVLKEPVPFIMMGTGDTQMTVKVVFMLAVTQPSEQLQLLERLTGVFQDNQVLKDMLEMNEEEIEKILNTKLNN